MFVVKILPKGQITLPKGVRESLHLHVGDTLVVDETKGGIVMRKGKTILDFVGVLPNIGLSIEEMRERAVKEASKDNA
ncbi:MAG: AbrB/MazE/SpoVT family DNA-binding domain-containing protein [Deltaproteobacteria bacterium]|nr:AbrB/MazE/SpoVT family DNA-binding domain-containing protein [Deltaproteobacteria bacterium]